MPNRARLLVLWQTPTDPDAFHRHYREVHVPLANKMPGLRRYTLSRSPVRVRGEEPYYMVGELDFDDLASLRAAFQSSEGQATAADAALLERFAKVRSMICELEDVAGES
jgi:uncharacterized protein (TIGR02118 family)